MDVDCGSGWVESNSANFENYFKKSSIRFSKLFQNKTICKTAHGHSKTYEKNKTG